MGLNFKLMIVFMGLVFLMGLAITLTFTTLDYQTDDAVVINLAGRQRMLSQEMSKEALSLFSGITSSNDDLRNTSRLFNETLAALISGGKASLGGDRYAEIPPTTDSAILLQLEKIEGLWDKFHRQIKIILSKDSSPQSREKAAMYVAENNVALLEETNNAVGLYEMKSSRSVERLKGMQLLFLLVAAICAIGGSALLSRLIVSPLNKVVDFAGRFGAGDLAAKLEIHSKDEIGDMAASLSDMAGKLRDMIKSIRETSFSVASASEQISSATEQLAVWSESQAKQVTEVASSMEEMASSVQGTYKNAQDTLEISRKTSERASSGDLIVARTMSSMVTIERTIAGSGLKINSLGERSKAIGKIVVVIKNIAAQTNLLALNAAIEANRAGEHGRGFDVVAEEIRKLAEKASQSTIQISEIVEEMQTEILSSVGSMGEVIKEVEKGMALSTQTGAALKEIIGEIGKSGDSIQLMFEASRQQAAVSDQVAAAMEKASNTIEESAVSAEEIAHTAQELAKLGDNLKRLANNFII